MAVASKGFEFMDDGLKGFFFWSFLECQSNPRPPEQSISLRNTLQNKDVQTSVINHAVTN